MTPTTTVPRLRSSRGLLTLGVLMAGGIALGWFLLPHQARTLTCVYAVIEPGCVAALCASALYHQVKHSRWLVPLLLVGVLTNVAWRPNDTPFTAIGLAAGVLAILTSLFGRTRTAIAASLLCCAAVTATSLADLLGRGG